MRSDFSVRDFYREVALNPDLLRMHEELLRRGESPLCAEAMADAARTKKVIIDISIKIFYAKFESARSDFIPPKPTDLTFEEGIGVKGLTAGWELCDPTDTIATEKDRYIYISALIFDKTHHIKNTLRFINSTEPARITAAAERIRVERTYHGND